MTEAERFLQEKLNPPKPIVAESVVDTTPTPVSDNTPAFLKKPAFANHRIFWSVAFVLVIALIDVTIMAVTDAFETIGDIDDLRRSDAAALIVSLLTPISFWIPILLVSNWAWSKKFTNFLMWAASIWMIILHLLKIGFLFSISRIEAGQVLLGIIMFLFGALGIAAVLWNTIKNRKIEVKPSVKSFDSSKGASDVKDKVKRESSNKRIKLTCKGCRKTYTAMVKTGYDVVVCPHCNIEYRLVDIEGSVKEPVCCQVARALMYIMGVIMIIGSIGLMFEGRIPNVVAGALWAWLTFGSASGLKAGKGWPRVVWLIISLFFIVGYISTASSIISGSLHVFQPIVLPFVIPTALMFMPSSNAWLSVRKMLRKAIAEEVAKGCHGS